MVRGLAPLRSDRLVGYSVDVIMAKTVLGTELAYIDARRFVCTGFMVTMVLASYRNAETMTDGQWYEKRWLMDAIKYRRLIAFAH
jgi:hypothetical protein